MSTTGEPASPQRRGRKQPKPKKKQSTNDRILEEIQYLQQSTDTIIPRAAFHRLVREILIKDGVGLYDYRITTDALLALQESTEMYLSQLSEDRGCATMHREGDTLSIQDLLLIQLLRRNR